MSLSVPQLFIATAESQAQLVLQFVEVAKFSLYVNQFLLQAALYRRTRLQAIPSQPQEPPNLAEFESQTLYAADKGERLNVLVSVLTEATLCSWGSRQQGVALVKPNRVNAKTDPFRDDANLHCVGSFLEATPWSIVQSQTLLFHCGIQ
jgi:hypothetical protein